MIAVKNRRPSGFALLEAVLLMTGLAAGMALGGAVLVLALQTQRSVNQTDQRLVDQVNLAEQFRTDVRQADQTLPRTELGKDKVVASSTCLILKGPGQRQVVYRWLSGKLERIEHNGDQTLQRPLAVAPATSVELVQGPGKGPLITLKWKEPAPQGKPERSMELSALLGGDLR